MREKQGKPRTSKQYRTTDISIWSAAFPILKELFGEDCLTLDEEGIILPNPKDPTAWEVLGILAKGIFRKDWQWVPVPAESMRFLRAYRAFLAVMGEKADRSAVTFLTQLAGRTRPICREHVDARDVETVVAAYAYLFVLTNTGTVPNYLRPKNASWLWLWKKSTTMTMKVKWDNAVKDGHVPHDPRAFLAKVAAYYGKTSIMDLSPTESFALLTVRSSEDKVRESMGLPPSSPL
jgi:hypothetical protein